MQISKTNSFLGHLDFIVFYTKAKLEAETFRHFAGYLWWILDPLFGVGVYFILFKVLLNRGGPDYIQFLFIGLVTWKWFSDSVIKSSSSILGSLDLIKKIRINKSVFPTVEIFYNTWKFLVIFMFIILLYVATGYPITWNYLFLFPLLLSQLVLIFGASFLFASITPFIPDLNFFLNYSLRLMFYPSGVLFALSSIPQKYVPYVKLNPMAGLIEGYRNIIMKGLPPSFEAIIYALILGGISYFIGSFFINKYEQEYPKLS